MPVRLDRGIPLRKLEGNLPGMTEDSGPGNYMTEIAQCLRMGSNVSAPVVLTQIRESARSA